MPSFQITLSPSRRSAGRFVNAVRRALLKALSEERKKNGLNQSEIARRIGVHRSVVTRQLTGREDISLSRVGEYAYAMGRIPRIELQEKTEPMGANAYVRRGADIAKIQTANSNEFTFTARIAN